MYRKREKELKYVKDREKADKCPFCDPDPKAIVADYPHFYVIKNTYPYHLWDRKKVVEHLMAVPKVHTEGFEGFPKDCYKEYISILQEYSESGYDFFTRTSKSSRKTQPHFHTHFIKTTGKVMSLLHFNADPYYLIYK